MLRNLNYLILIIFCFNLIFANNFFTTDESGSHQWNLGIFNQTKSNINNVSLEDNDLLQDFPDNNLQTSWINMSENVLLFHMNEKSGTIVDSSGNGNDGTQNGGITYGTSGKLNDSLSFDGIDDYIDLGTTDSNVKKISVSTWIKQDVADHGMIYYNGFITTGGNNYGFYLLITGTGSIWTNVGVGSSSYSNIRSINTYADSNWHHVVSTYDGISLKLFVDGILIGTNTTVSGNIVYASSPNNQELIGAREYDPAPVRDSYFKGSIDEVAVWNKVLSEIEIETIYNRQKGKYLLEGNYTSQIFDSSEDVNWANLTWNSYPYNQELPNNQLIETNYDEGNVNMSGNKILLHLNDVDKSIVDSSGNDNNAIIGGPLLFMDFEGGIANDYSDNNADGTLMGSPNYNSNCDLNLGCFELDGIDDYISLGTNSLLRQTSKISYSFWVKIPVGSLGGKIAGVGANGGHGYGGIEVSDDSIFYSWTPSNPVSDSTFGNYSLNLADDTWHHIVLNMNFENDYGEIFLDGIQLGTTTSQAISDWTPKTSYNSGYDDTIGGRFINSYYYFNGSIDEFLINSRMLSSSEVSYLYNSKKTYVLNLTSSPLNNGLNLIDKISYLNLGTNSPLRQDKEITYSFWMKIPVGSLGGKIAGVGANGGQGYGGIEVSDDSIFYSWTPSNPVSDSTFGNYSLNLADDTWHHIVLNMNFENNLGKIYLDGTEIGTTTSQAISDWSPQSSYNSGYDDTIGGRFINSQFYFNGSIDEVAIWNRSLLADEILNIYKRGILKLNLSARSCNDAVCSGETWTNCPQLTTCDLSSLNQNQYFQYKVNLFSYDTNYSPFLEWINITYFTQQQVIEPEYIFPTPNNGAKISANSFEILAYSNESMINISDCEIILNSQSLSMNYSNNYCSYILSNLGAQKTQYTFQLCYNSSNNCLEERTFTYFPTPEIINEVPGLGISSIVIFITLILGGIIIK